MSFAKTFILAILALSAGTGLPVMAGRTITIKNLDKIDQVTVRIAEEWYNYRDARPSKNEFDVVIPANRTQTEATNSGANSVLTYWRINGSAWSDLGALAGSTFYRRTDDNDKPLVGLDGADDYGFEVFRDAPGSTWKLRMVSGPKIPK